MKVLSALMKALSNMSARELNLWAELLINILVALYYFPIAFRLMQKDEWILATGAMIGLAISTIILAIVVGIAISIPICIWKKPVKKDERDYQFSARGSMIAYAALFFFVMLIIGQAMFEGLCPGIASKLGLITNPLIIAHLLLLSLMFSSTIKSVVQLFFYRRGY